MYDTMKMGREEDVKKGQLKTNVFRADLNAYIILNINNDYIINNTFKTAAHANVFVMSAIIDTNVRMRALSDIRFHANAVHIPQKDDTCTRI